MPDGTGAEDERMIQLKGLKVTVLFLLVTEQKDLIRHVLLVPTAFLFSLKTQSLIKQIDSCNVNN